MENNMNLKKLCKQAKNDFRMHILYDTHESFQSLMGCIFIKVRAYNCIIYTDRKVIYYEPCFPRLDELKKIYPNYKLIEDSRNNKYH